MLYFNSKELPKPQNKYVSWIDIMGIQEKMSRSLAESANFISKFHMAVSKNINDDILIYPIMDAVYATSTKRTSMTDFINALFSDMFSEFSNEPKEIYKFIIRCSLAFGPVIHGKDIPDSAFQKTAGTIDKNNWIEMKYRESILLGIPMIQAHQSERHAPPFGVFIHESARSFAQGSTNPIPLSWHKWFDDADGCNKHKEVEKYFSWCRQNSFRIGYAEEKIDLHDKMAKQYFCG
ncbi:hypothetical protein [Oleispirillum naphthae]|uniref:hypothetical protein n=1 Tax=Oleispirillum naphthae TaxID=2838853 RepID=UPI00308222FB